MERCSLRLRYAFRVNKASLYKVAPDAGLVLDARSASEG